MAQRAKTIILNNSYKIYCVKCPWFWFWLVFGPYAAWAVFCGMDETLDVRLPSLFAITNSERQQSDKNTNFYWNLIKLYSTQNGYGHVCVPYATWLLVSLWRRDLSWDSLPIIAYAPPNWSIKWNIFWLKVSVLYEQLLSNVPYATLCPICSGMFTFFVY